MQGGQGFVHVGHRPGQVVAVLGGVLGNPFIAPWKLSTAGGDRGCVKTPYRKPHRQVQLRDDHASATFKVRPIGLVAGNDHLGLFQPGAAVDAAEVGEGGSALSRLCLFPA
jgi:hypothetical protein